MLMNYNKLIDIFYNLTCEVLNAHKSNLINNIGTYNIFTL